MSSSSYNNHHHGLSSPASGSRTAFSQASTSPSPSVHGGVSSSPAHHVAASYGGASFKDAAAAAASTMTTLRSAASSTTNSALSSTLGRQPLELSIALDNNNVTKTATAVTGSATTSAAAACAFDGGGGGLSVPKDLPTPSSTPTTTRKTRRRSNLFNPSKKDDKNRCLTTGELGSGRAIPLKQGYLYKRSSKGLNKEWKKKYVALCDDGRLTYHPSLHVSNVHLYVFCNSKLPPLTHTHRDANPRYVQFPETFSNSPKRKPGIDLTVEVFRSIVSINVSDKPCIDRFDRTDYRSGVSKSSLFVPSKNNF